MKRPSLTEKQKLMYAYGKAHHYSLLCADPRLGKSRVAIKLQQRRQVNCLVVCPSHLITNWGKEIKKWSPDSIVTMFRKGKDIYDVFDTDITVTSYDLVTKAPWLFEWSDMVIADEIHILKNMASKKSQFFHQQIFENSTKYLHGLTGTPLKNRVKEFYSLLALMNYNPKQTDHSFLDTYPDEITFAEHFSFSETYDVEVSKGKKTWRMPVTSYKGLRNKKELKKWLEGKYIRIRAEKGDLPPISYLDTLVSDIDDKQLLREFNQQFVRDEDVRKYVREENRLRDKKNKIKGSEVREMRTGSTLSEHKKSAALKKVPFTIKYVENLMESVKCCLVYSDHKDPVHELANHFEVPAITGAMPASRRAQLVNDFQAGKFNILCATIGSLKEGADLYRAKDTVFNDLPWIPGDLLQVINRTRAIGEKDPRTVHRIFGSPQDEKIAGVLEEKIKTIDEAT